MEREQVFQWVQAKDIKSIIEFLKKGDAAIKEDEITQNAIGYFLIEIIESMNESDFDENNFVLSQLFALHIKKFHTFPEEQFEKIIVQLAMNAKNEEQAFEIASYAPTNIICGEIIAKYNESKPKQVEHTQTDKIKVQNIITYQENITKSIFNSQQEILFFLALRNCFPSHYIYPNIGLTTILKFKQVEGILEGKEKNYFFTTTIDFVVIDQFNDFKPMFAIELDSEWHRLNQQGEKDAIKNKILKAAGLPFYRIEHTSKYKTIDEFEKVIIEITKKALRKDNEQ